jgi:SIR2-like domain
MSIGSQIAGEDVAGREQIETWGWSMDLQNAINLARRGGAVAFMGAGFSAGAKNRAKAPIPSSSDLKKVLSEPLGAGIDTDLSVLADLYIDQFGETALRNTLIESFSAKEVATHHCQILSLPWRRVYTTNYDDVCELAADKVQKPLISATLSDAPDEQPSGKPLLVHLHGSIRSYSHNQGSQIDFQLSSSSYLTSRFPSSPWSPTLRNDIRFARVVFFVGYSLSDFDIARLIYDESQLPTGEFGIREKIHIICRPTTPTVEQKRLSKFGNVWPIGVEQFAASLFDATVDEPEAETPVFIAFKPYSPSMTLREPTQDDYVELLTKGTFQPHIYEFARSGDKFYATPRYALSFFERPSFRRRVLVHAGLGNGKTLFLDELRQDLVSRDIRVFEFVRRAEVFTAEIDTIVSMGARVCLIFDNFFRHRDIVAYAHAHVGRDDIIICSCRTLQYEFERDEIVNTIGGNFIEIDINYLSRVELSYFSRAFTTYGLWGRINHYSDERKIAYLKNQCSAELRSIVLHAFNSGPVSQKIKKWTKGIEESTANVKTFVLSAVLISLIHGDFSFLDLCDILERRPDNMRAELRTTEAADLVLPSGLGQVGVRSAILAEHIATRSFEAETVLEGITTLVRRLAGWLHAGPSIRDLLRELMRFALVARLFEASDRRDFIISFYEGIRDIEFCRRNPQFWLQYAMARIDRGEYPLADKLLGVAESRQQQLGYNSFQIDNQRARFLLISRAKGGEYTDYQPAYVRACQLIFKQLRESRGKADPYPLKLILPHEDFVTKRFENLDAGAKQLCGRVLQAFKQRLEEWPAHQQQHEYHEWTDALGRCVQVMPVS